VAVLLKDGTSTTDKILFAEEALFEIYAHCKTSQLNTHCKQEPM